MSTWKKCRILKLVTSLGNTNTFCSFSLVHAILLSCLLFSSMFLPFLFAEETCVHWMSCHFSCVFSQVHFKQLHSYGKVGITLIIGIHCCCNKLIVNFYLQRLRSCTWLRSDLGTGIMLQNFILLEKRLCVLSFLFCLSFAFFWTHFCGRAQFEW